jgi:hypothetical protein
MFAETKLGQVFCDLVSGLLGLCPFSEATFPSLICCFTTNQRGEGVSQALPVVIPQQFHVAHIGI